MFKQITIVFTFRTADLSRLRFPRKTYLQIICKLNDMIDWNWKRARIFRINKLIMVKHYRIIKILKILYFISIQMIGIVN